MKQFSVEVTTFTVQGQRKRNEDRLLSKSLSNNCHLLIVADGMGGYDDGHLAADITINEIQNHLESSINGNAKESIELAFFKAHATINKLLDNAGATAGGILLLEELIYCFWLGDVRIILKNGEDIFISKEHTLLNLLREADIVIRPEELVRLKNTVVRSLGGKSNSYTPEIVTFKRSEGIKGLIFTDGLNEFYSTKTLANMLEEKDHSILQDISVYKNSKDNVTGIIFTVSNSSNP